MTYVHGWQIFWRVVSHRQRDIRAGFAICNLKRPWWLCLQTSARYEGLAISTAVPKVGLFPT